MKKHTFFAAFCFLSTSSIAHSAIVNMTELNSKTPVGQITITSTEYGTVFTPELSNLPSGLHGFHIHTNPSCESATINNKTILGGAAGGHYDPENTGKHGFPWTSNNHLGDLPALYVDHHGIANQPVIAPRIKLSDLKGRSIMIHAGGDNHSDHPAALGGGGGRLVCGVIK
ncbi:superoxide dismutase family protein [Aliivibrio fischeri]|uniref:Superoxide dismutase [Cu-Zn] n=1 Tax=Aliivibrio fischeri TaxID=668 RepID=A0A510UGT4_ALIFS|nr:superoxide dismutase family protein [Aliivibrio fischeri]MUJ38936.1 superoxide dismutase [Aliivibrio fischeri]MUK48293.1 superoxide dismutase [Aliivibrio fischeri]GEK13777.1 superoxide dismutase [Cu-Zn] [Aliivibrio fischeri]